MNEDPVTERTSQRSPSHLSEPLLERHVPQRVVGPIAPNHVAP